MGDAVGGRGIGAAILLVFSMAISIAMIAKSIALSAQTQQLRLVSTAWPPFTNAPGQPRFALELVEAALARIGLKANTTIVDAERFTTSLLGGQFDGSAAAWKDAEREKVLLYSQPYLENRLILVGRRGSDVSAATLGDLKGKRIAIVEGYSYGEIDNSGVAFLRSSSEEASLRLLIAGAADYTLMDELVVQNIVSHYPEESRTKLQLGSTPLLRRQLYFAVRKTLPDAEAIVNRFNSQLRAMVTDGTYHRLLQVSWIQADVDGDGLTEYVPQSDRAGTIEPQRAYSLLTVDQPTTPQPRESGPRFYVGGQIYQGWTGVPDMYKVMDRPNPSVSAGSIFKFTW